MDTSQWMLALISIAIALVILVLSRLPRPVLVLVVAAIVGAVTGVLMLLGRTSTVICDFTRPVSVDRCSGQYTSLMGADRRLPQFMQGSHADAWLIGTAALLGAVLVVIVALVALLAWSRMRRIESVTSAA
jgi:glycerol uptake facilitator-like aquaporin